MREQAGEKTDEKKMLPVSKSTNDRRVSALQDNEKTKILKKVSFCARPVGKKRPSEVDSKSNQIEREIDNLLKGFGEPIRKE